MKNLGLFSGIGGFELGLEWAGINTVAFCEMDKKCQQVLRMNFPGVPIIDNVREVTIDRLNAEGIKKVDIVTGGFPCQPFSVAGERRGKSDDRYLWPEMLRVIAEVRPTWVICENVVGIVRMALDTVLSDLESIGYATRPFNIPACAVNAPHQRKRIWIVAYDSNSFAKQKIQAVQGRERSPKLNGVCSNVANSTCGHGRTGFLQGHNKIIEKEGKGAPDRFAGDGEIISDSKSKNGGRLSVREKKEYTELSFTNWWETEPDVGRVVDGFPGRVDRLKQLGNAVVPQIPYLIAKTIMKIEANK